MILYFELKKMIYLNFKDVDIAMSSSKKTQKLFLQYSLSGIIITSLFDDY